MKLPNTDRLSFDQKKHAYTLDGKLLSGVTSVIDGTSSKSNLIDWAANMAVDYIKENQYLFGSDEPFFSQSGFDNVLQEARKAHTRRKEGAATKGTDTHALVEAYILLCIEKDGDPRNLTGWGGGEDIKPFINWATSNNVQFLAAEQRLYSEKHHFAGTCDFVALIDGKLTIGDLKTYPKMWSADAFIQMGAYSLAWQELTRERPAQSIVVKMCDPSDERLKKYNCDAFATYPRYALEEDEDMFLTRLKMYRYNQNFVSPKK